MTSTPTAHPLAHQRAPASRVDPTNRQLLAWQFSFIKPVIGLVLLSCLWLGVSVASEVMTTFQTGQAITVVKQVHDAGSAGQQGLIHWLRSGDKDAQKLWWVVLALSVQVVILVVSRYLREVANAKMSMSMVFYIREAVYDRLQRVGQAFHDQLSSGQLINRALSDLQNVRAFVQTAILMTLDIFLIVGGYIILMAIINPWLALLSLVPLPIWTWYILRFSKRIQPLQKSVMEADDKNVSIITEAIAGVHVIKAFATEQVEVTKYNANCDTFRERVLRRIRMFADFQPVIRLIASTSHLSLFFLGGYLVITGRMAVGNLVVLGTAMSAILGRLQQVATINEQYQNAMVSSRRLYEVIMADPTVPEMPGATPLPKGTGQVAFEQVGFGYDPVKPVIHDIELTVPGGTVVAIVGPTGAGKSTLVNLIARFYDPQAGRVLIDGMDIRNATLHSVRTQVAFVFQETYLFSDTVAANIAYGRPGITQGEIEAAARLAQAHDFIDDLPKKYETIIGERGSGLSGGQRQRLAIARAIVTNPRILILDDATASVDPETEDLIRRGMRYVMVGRTTFVIAHRISTVKAADLVVVLENGRVTQIGTHDQLMAEDGHYREIAAVQLHSGEPTPDATQSPSHMRRVSDDKHVTATAAAVQQQDPPPAAEPV